MKQLWSAAQSNTWDRNTIDNQHQTSCLRHVQYVNTYNLYQTSVECRSNKSNNNNNKEPHKNNLEYIDFVNYCTCTCIAGHINQRREQVKQSNTFVPQNKSMSPHSSISAQCATAEDCWTTIDIDSTTLFIDVNNKKYNCWAEKKSCVFVLAFSSYGKKQLKSLFSCCNPWGYS